MVDKKYCDNCNEEIIWEKGQGSVRFHKHGFFNGKSFDYDFCSIKCLKELVDKI